MQMLLFPSRENPNAGFPNPLLVPVKARNYVSLVDVMFRRAPLTIGTTREMWWAIQPHAVLFEVTQAEASRIPHFERQTDMESYIERLVAFELDQSK